MITYTMPLDITSGAYPSRIFLSQYDSAFSLKFILFSSDGVVSFSQNITAEIRGTKADGNGYSAEASYSNGVVTVTGDGQMTAIAGDNVFEIVLHKDNRQLGTANFILDVTRATLDKDTITSNSVIRELIDITDRAEEIVEAGYRIEELIDGINHDSEDILEAKEAAVNAATEAKNAASSAAADVKNELSSDIKSINAVKTYIQTYVEGLLYADEVSY